MLGGERVAVISDNRNIVRFVFGVTEEEHWWSSSPIVTAYSGKTKV